MRSALASLVRTSAQPDQEKASPESGPDCTAKSCEQLTPFALPGSSLKTPRESAPVAGASSSATSWRSDIPGETEPLQRLISERHTAAIVGGALRNVPTPTVCGNYNRKGASATSGDGLATWAKKMFPTVTRSDGTGGPRKTIRKDGRVPNDLRSVVCLLDPPGGPLNPPWVEWLMGWPMGHTELRHSATAKFPSVQRLHGDCSGGQ